MTPSDVAASYQQVRRRLCVTVLRFPQLRQVARKRHGLRLAVHFKNWCWLKAASGDCAFDEETAVKWIANFPMLPHQFHALLFDGTADSERCHVYIGTVGSGDFSVSHSENGRVVLEAHRSWSFQNQMLKYDFIRARKDRVDQLLPARFLRASFNLYHELGFTAVHLTAGYEKGGYVWAKFGFVPTSQAEWRKLALRLESRLSRIRHRLSRDVFEYLKDRVNSDDLTVIWEISDLNKDIGGQKLGWFLLKKTEWKGEISLNDSIAMDRFNTYIVQKGLKPLSWAGH